MGEEAPSSLGSHGRGGAASLPPPCPLRSATRHQLATGSQHRAPSCAPATGGHKVSGFTAAQSRQYNIYLERP